jgi:two-component system NtrC family response regulator
MSRILAIDDESSVLESYRMALDDVHEIVTADGGNAGLQALGTDRFDLVLLDINMPDRSGMDILREIRERDIDATVIMVTVHREVEMVVEAMNAGASDYITKPFKVTELRHAIERNLRLVSLERKNRTLEASLRESGLGGEEIVFESLAMVSAFKALEKAAPTDSSVLITGESGTGKELAAHFVHRNSGRSAEPILIVNCAAIPDTLLESELFGHERGAFSGATERKMGKFELADGGTIFLDEIGTLPLDLQAKLLRALENRVIERIGGTDQIDLDVRWMAATNRDLGQLVADGKFREDLFYRLHVIAVTLPPLRERPEDIPILASHFMEQFARDLKRTPLSLSDEVLEVLQIYEWPGNVRELKNLFERLSVLEPGEEIRVESLPREMLDAYQKAIGVDITTASTSTYKSAMHEFRRAFIIRSLRTAGGNQAKAARILGLHRNTLLHHLRSLDIQPEEYEIGGDA